MLGNFEKFPQGFLVIEYVFIYIFGIVLEISLHDGPVLGGRTRNFFRIFILKLKTFYEEIVYKKLISGKV